MAPHEERVQLEYEELSQRLSKLKRFIKTEEFMELHPVERDALAAQAKYMELYQNILVQRIARFMGV